MLEGFGLEVKGGMVGFSGSGMNEVCGSPQP